jgi:DNA-binding transcriptional ArsR family regulator
MELPMSLDRVDVTSLVLERDTPVEGTNLNIQAMAAKAFAASGFLKALSHEGRLMILCHLISGERSVTELEKLLDLRQAAVSQQLARLRLEGLVCARRDGKAIFYSIQDPKVLRTIRLVSELFCTCAK